MTGEPDDAKVSRPVRWGGSWKRSVSHLASCLPNDSYPSGLGRELWSLYHGHFDRDLDAMLRVLLDEHPAGWSCLMGADIGLLPIAGEPTSSDQAQSLPEKVKGNRPTRYAPLCYCHGERSEAGLELTQVTASWSGCEWAYAFVAGEEVRHDVLMVLCSYRRSGQKMVGAFGQGESAAQWVIIALVALNGSEPDWDSLDAAPPLSPLVSLSPFVAPVVIDRDAGSVSPVQRDDRPGIYAVRLADGALHYVRLQSTSHGTVVYCTCSPDEAAPCPTCPHSQAVRSFLQGQRDQARQWRARGLEYSGGRSIVDDRGAPLAISWHSGQPQILLSHRAYAYRFGCLRDEDTLSLPLALAILSDFCGDEELALRLYREFDRHLLVALVAQDRWHLGAGDIEDFLEQQDLLL